MALSSESFMEKARLCQQIFLKIGLKHFHLYCKGMDPAHIFMLMKPAFLKKNLPNKTAIFKGDGCKGGNHNKVSNCTSSC